MTPARSAPLDPALRRRGLLVLAAGVAAAGATLALPRVAQDPAYHAFADARAWAGVPNAANVLSSLLLSAAGLAGLLAVAGDRARFSDPRERAIWRVLFASVALVGPGSAWYHLDPSNATLVWDRLPMAAGFAALLAAIVAERIGPAAGARLLVPLVAAGALSVLYWHVTEARGAGDLRPYAFVQLYPLLSIPLLFALFPARYGRGADWLAALGLYAASKAAEGADAVVFRAGGLVSGHTLKHALAALGVAVLARMLLRRGALVPGAGEGPCISGR
jgi:hypothetical protein